MRITITHRPEQERFSSKLIKVAIGLFWVVAIWLNGFAIGVKVQRAAGDRPVSELQATLKTAAVLER